MKWIGLIAGGLMAACCFMVWVTIESKDLVLTGVDTSGTRFGKPGYFHLVLAAIFLILNFTPRVWAKRFNLVVTALNVAWAVRNFFIIAGCSGGECPVRGAGIWLVMISSLLMLIAALFPDMKMRQHIKPAGRG